MPRIPRGDLEPPSGGVADPPRLGSIPGVVSPHHPTVGKTLRSGSSVDRAAQSAARSMSQLSGDGAGGNGREVARV